MIHSPWAAPSVNKSQIVSFPKNNPLLTFKKTSPRLSTVKPPMASKILFVTSLIWILSAKEDENTNLNPRAYWNILDPCHE